MSSEYTDESENAELRRRAAWLLGLLILVAGLLVVILVTFFNDSGGSNSTGPGPTIVGPPSSSSRAPSAHSTAPTSTSRSSTAPSSPTGGPASCPGSAPCVVDGDPGNVIAAINAYRTAHNKPAATGTVSKAAQDCAVSNGDNCSGSWAESQVDAATGQAALDQILSRGHVLSDYSTFEVGWAWDPAAKQYFFAMIRTG